MTKGEKDGIRLLAWTELTLTARMELVAGIALSTLRTVSREEFIALAERSYDRLKDRLDCRISELTAILEEGES